VKRVSLGRFPVGEGVILGKVAFTDLGRFLHGEGCLCAASQAVSLRPTHKNRPATHSLPDPRPDLLRRSSQRQMAPPASTIGSRPDAGWTGSAPEPKPWTGLARPAGTGLTPANSLGPV